MIVDEVDGELRVGPEIYEDLKDFLEPGKQPFDHAYETLFMHVIQHLIIVSSKS